MSRVIEALERAEYFFADEAFGCRDPGREADWDRRRELSADAAALRELKEALEEVAAMLANWPEELERTKDSDLPLARLARLLTRDEARTT